MTTTLDWIFMAGKLAFVVGIFLTVVPLMVWVERRGSALMQNRLGPNRVGPLGLLQTAADAIKFIFKEDRAPGHVNKFYYTIAPVVAVIPAFMAFAVIPFAGPIVIDGKEYLFKVTDLDVGFLYVLAIGSLGVYGVIIAGWASNSKYALFGSLRSTAQMVSYELSLGLSVIGIIMTFSTVNLSEIAFAQGEWIYPLTLFGIEAEWLKIPRWGVFLQPLGFILFLVAAFAETNRLPFDMAEGESEIVAGFHLEYGAMKFALFFMAEYLHMLTASALIVTFYFGGWQLIPGMHALHAWLVDALALEGALRDWARVILEHISFATKVGFFMWFFVWVRWTLPRFRYDQLMSLGWKVMLPLSLANVALTGVLIYFEWL